MKEAPLVLIHGYPFDKTMWHPVVAAIGSRVKTLLPDLPGFGSAATLRQEPSIEGYADSIVEFTRSHGFKQAIYAGMSMGGYVALALAEKYPAEILGLGLISTQAAADTDETRAARQELIAKIRAKGVGAAIEGILPKMFAPGKEADEDLARFVRQGAERAGVAGLTWALQAMAARPDRTGFLRKFERPVLFAHGPADKIIPLEKAQALADQIPRAISAPIPKAGHATPLEHPDAVANALVRLVEKVRQQAAQA